MRCDVVFFIYLFFMLQLLARVSINASVVKKQQKKKLNKKSLVIDNVAMQFASINIYLLLILVIN